MNQIDQSKHVVLYADDDHDDLELLSDSFNRYTNNVEVIKASDGYEALAYLKNLSPLDPSPCLIVLDVNMPRLNGTDTLVKIKSMDRFKHVPVVLFTTSSSSHEKKFAEENGAAAFVTKPINTPQLKKIAEQFLSYCAEDVKSNIQAKLR